VYDSSASRPKSLLRPPVYDTSAPRPGSLLGLSLYDASASRPGSLLRPPVYDTSAPRPGSLSGLPLYDASASRAGPTLENDEACPIYHQNTQQFLETSFGRANGLFELLTSTDLPFKE
jgi:hypothetical protein